MTKRILAWVLVLALVFSLMPLVSAETEAPGMSEWHDHTTHEGWTAWSGTTGLPTTAGKYYLTADVTLTKEWTVPSGETHLCLNGHHITQTGSNHVWDREIACSFAGAQSIDTHIAKAFTVRHGTDAKGVQHKQKDSFHRFTSLQQMQNTECNWDFSAFCILHSAFCIYITCFPWPLPHPGQPSSWW